MEILEKTIANSIEKREHLRQDFLFVRVWLEQIGQTRVQRWRKEGEKPFTDVDEVQEMNESVAEHVGQMYGLALEILDKATFERDYSFDGFDLLLALRMIRSHDTEEMITGDVRKKDSLHYRREDEAIMTVKKRVSELNYGQQIVDTMTQYREMNTKEAYFVKAIDELQAWFYIIYSRRFDTSKRNFNEPESIPGYVYSKEFPTLRRIMDIVLRIMRNPKSIKAGVPLMELIKEQYRDVQ